MNRRSFLVRTAGLAAAGLFAPSLMRANPQAPGPKPAPAKPPPGPAITEFKPLRRNVGIFTGRGGTIGWLASSSSLIVVDTQFPDTAAACATGLPGRGSRTIDAVINTHHHFDHTAGNSVFRALTRTIVAHAKVPGLQAAAAEKAGTVADQVYADTTFTDVWRHDCGDEAVLAQYSGPAHTGGDAVICFEKANVIHMGDLVFNRMYPYIDRPGGASVRGWVRRLEEEEHTLPADAIYIFGHGNPKFGVTGTQKDLAVMRGFLNGMLEYVQKGIDAGWSRDQITVLDNLPGFDDWHVPKPNRLGGILGTVYDELTAKA